MSRFIESIRGNVKKSMTHIAKFIDGISGGRITPNMITFTGLIAHVYIAYLIAQNYFIWAALLLLIFGLFDTLDGSLARLQGSASKTGMLLDSVTDRVKEVMLYAGIAYAFIASGNASYAVWVVLACGMSVIVSYVNAWGEAVSKNQKPISRKTNKVFRVGFMSFDVRMFVLFIGLLSGYLIHAVILIAILAPWTAVERFYLITRDLKND